jgi:hypothetical protein
VIAAKVQEQVPLANQSIEAYLGGCTLIMTVGFSSWAKSVSRQANALEQALVEDTLRRD